MDTDRFILTLSCPDKVGIVAAVSSLFARHIRVDCGVAQPRRPGIPRFFMRLETLADSFPFGVEELRRQFAPIASQFEMTWKISETSAPKTRGHSRQQAGPLP